ncbi:MAG TPA: hypothetical protein VFK86_08610 [Bauldia sp.]|nr:hypothetical protein [Bauldia sp.]
MSEPVGRAQEVPAANPLDRLLGSAASRPSVAQRKYLSRGLGQAGGKLPLFDEEGRQIDRKTVESCMERGWAEPWFRNPVKPDWLVCRLTRAGYAVLGASPPG